MRIVSAACAVIAFVWLAAAVAARETRGAAAAREMTARTEAPGPDSYALPLVPLQRAAGSRFVEIQEVRVRADGRLFYCTGVQGLLVADASDPRQIRSLAHLRPSHASERFPRCQHVAFEGDVVYVTSRGDELQPRPFATAFDVSRSPPAEIASFAAKPGRSFEGIAASAGKVYVAMHSAGVLVLERTPAGLVERGTATGLVDARGVEVVGARAYVADGAGGLAVIDVADPDRPRLVSRAPLPGSAASVAVRGWFAYVAAGSAGLAVADISDPARPRLAASAAAPGNALQVSLFENFAFLADWNDARVYDVSRPARPRLIAVERVPTDSPFSRVLGIAARGRTVFLGEWTGMYSYELHPERKAPHLTVKQRSVEFGRVRPPQTDSVDLEVKNEGSAPLIVSSIEVRGSPAFAAEPRNLRLQPGQEATVQIAFKPRSEGLAQGALVLRTDDPSVADAFEVPLLGNAAGLSVGQRAPELIVDLPDGRRWKLSEHAGQTVLLAYFATF